jgi:hypothetical protein
MIPYEIKPFSQADPRGISLRCAHFKGYTHILPKKLAQRDPLYQKGHAEDLQKMVWA